MRQYCGGRGGNFSGDMASKRLFLWLEKIGHTPTMGSGVKQGQDHCKGGLVMAQIAFDYADTVYSSGHCRTIYGKHCRLNTYYWD